MSSNEVKVIKSPVVPLRGDRRDFIEYAYRDEVIYYVRLSNGLIATKPDDFVNKIEVEEQPK